MSKFTLCYVKLPWVYFTTQDIDKQWGDDWNDAPYEYNAGEPYPPGLKYYGDGRVEKDEKDWTEDGLPKWEIKKVAVYGDVSEPADNFSNHSYSVSDINNGACAWLTINKYDNDTVYLQAGTTYQEFLKVCRDKGVEVYERT